MVPDLDRRLATATDILSDSPNRVRVTNGQDIFVISREYKGNEKTWLLTGFEAQTEGAKQRIASGRTGSADGLPEGSSPSAPLRTNANIRAADIQGSGAAADGAQRIDDRSMGRADELPEGSSPSAPLLAEDTPGAADLQPLPEEVEIAEAVAQARTALEADPELTLRMGEGPGAQEIRLADLLDDLDQDETLIHRMTSCSLKGTPK
ncbi:MAG: hypothetical protein QM682_02770 [Paracoccus sp. (in: a-proteobacteria)]|uniref:hypothetical protein n=1 Tax=Paracoccus sp. TaxID=267 RepID=UPI0039E551B0